MRVIGFRILFCAFFPLLLTAAAQEQQGLKPRDTPSDYSAIHEEPNAVFAADQLSQEQMKRALSTAMYGRYIVVEMGVFPHAGRTVNLWPEDFVLRNSANGLMLRAVDPATVARVMQKEPVHAHEVGMTPQANVGYSSGVPDASGNRTGGGWYGGVGSRVWVDRNPNAATTDDDRADLENELRAKEIPTGETAKPVAGYLYFPVPSKVKKHTKYTLHYSREGQIFTLELNAPK